MVKNEWVKDLKAGDTVWVVSRWRNRGWIGKVTRTGYLYVTLAPDHRIVKSTGEMKDLNYELFRNKEAHEQHQQLRRAWSRTTARITGTPPDGMTLEKINQLRELLGFPPIKEEK